MHYDMTEEQIAEWRNIRSKTMPLMRWASIVKPCVENGRRYAELVVLHFKPEFGVSLMYFPNGQIRRHWDKIVEKYDISQWCYLDDLDLACRPDASEKDVKSNENGNPDKCLKRLLNNFIKKLMTSRKETK